MVFKFVNKKLIILNQFVITFRIMLQNMETKNISDFYLFVIILL